MECSVLYTVSRDSGFNYVEVGKPLEGRVARGYDLSYISTSPTLIAMLRRH